ncbi:MAG: uroporphyrinogen-III synthase [Halobacteriaceae archaeon]
MAEGPHVAVLRPDDGRLEATADYLRSLGAEPVPDAMLSVEPTGTAPREDGDITVFTSTTGARLAGARDWTPTETDIVAIGPSTAAGLRENGYGVTLIPSQYSSAGLVSALAERAPGQRIEVARSDHGSPTLTEGLADAGGYVHETVLYRLARPEEAGASAVMAAAGDLDGILFTSSLTVEHFLEAAADRGVRPEAVAALNEEVIVGVIGEPTREQAAAMGLSVDAVPETADIEALAEAVIERIRPE